MRLSPRIGVLTLAVIVVGCGPKGAYQQAAETGHRIDDIRSNLVSTKTQITKTMASLDDLVNKPGDLKSQFKTYSDDVDKINAAFTRMRDRVYDMRSNRDAYMAQWQSDVNALSSEDLKERARQRMETAKANFSKLSDAIGALDDTSNAFLADINDLKRYFGADLTATGVKSVPEVVSRTHTEADATKAKIDAALVQLNTVSNAIAPTAPPQ